MREQEEERAGREDEHRFMAEQLEDKLHGGKVVQSLEELDELGHPTQANEAREPRDSEAYTERGRG